jgi:hypothetical protein
MDSEAGSTIYTYQCVGSLDLSIPISDNNRQFSFVGSKRLTSCDIARVKVSTCRISKKLSKPFTSPVFKNVQDTRLNRLFRPADVSDTRHHKPQSVLTHPTFLSPLVSGHVSGLRSRAKPLAKIRKHRFMHEVLSSEHCKYIFLVLVFSCL